MKLYATEKLADIRWRCKTLAERGAAMSLAMEAWIQEPAGSLPNDAEQLWLLAGARTPKEWQTVSAKVLADYKIVGNRLVSVELVELAQEMAESHEKRAKAGQIGGKSRSKAEADEKQNESNASSLLDHIDIDVDASEAALQTKDQDFDSRGDFDFDSHPHRDFDVKADRHEDAKGDEDRPGVLQNGKAIAQPSTSKSKTLPLKTTKKTVVKSSLIDDDDDNFDKRREFLKKQAEEVQARMALGSTR
jgi:uncharacterized protein YdaU (DUF1376 family)